MSRLILLVFTLPLFIYACSSPSTDKDEMLIFNNLFFQVQDGETQKELSKSLKDAYAEKIAYHKSQIPLFRVFAHNEYVIYIGIPFDTSLEVLTAQNRNGIEPLAQERADDFDYKIYKQGDLHQVEFVKKIDQSLIFFFAETSSDKILKGLFSRDALNQRIATK